MYEYGSAIICDCVCNCIDVYTCVFGKVCVLVCICVFSMIFGLCVPVCECTYVCVECVCFVCAQVCKRVVRVCICVCLGVSICVCIPESGFLLSVCTEVCICMFGGVSSCICSSTFMLMFLLPVLFSQNSTYSSSSTLWSLSFEINKTCGRTHKLGYHSNSWNQTIGLKWNGKLNSTVNTTSRIHIPLRTIFWQKITQYKPRKALKLQAYSRNGNIECCVWYE